MSRSITQIADEVYQIVAPLPPGFSVYLGEGDSIIIGTSELAFALTNHQIQDHANLGVVVKPAFNSLKKALSQYYSLRAAALDLEMFQTMAKASHLPSFQKEVQKW